MKVFISFSSADKKIAEKIYDRLKKYDIDCWICTKDIPPGADFQSCIVDAINKAAVVVLVFSSSANASAEIAKELSLASKKIVIPARIEDVLPQGSFQYQLSNRQFVDLFDDFDKNLDQIANQIKALVGNVTNTAVPIKQYRSNSLVKKLVTPIALGMIAISIGSWYFLSSRFSTPKLVNEVPQTTLVNSTKNTQQPIPAAVAATSSQVERNKAVELSSVTVSDKVKSLIPILNSTSDSARLSTLVAMKSQLPSDLNYLEAEILLDKSNGYRTDAIREIANLIGAKLNGTEAAVILGSLTDSARLSGIKSLLQNQKIKNNLNHKEAEALLFNTNGYRSDGIREIAGLLATNLTGADTAVILGSLTDSARLSSIKNISQNQKIQTNLNYKDAEILLLNTNGYRADAIREIAGLLVPNLNGSEVAVILGSLTDSARLNGINSIFQNHKIKVNLNASDLDEILTGTGGYKADALKIIASLIKI